MCFCSYFADIRRIASAEYIPDNQDIVLIHPPPKGIHEMTFQLAHTTHRYFDMGREYRNLPQKKLHFLDDVKFLVFVVPIAEYDSPSSEEPQPASLRAALDQFISIINSPWFSNASTFIFFNQMDKFKKKLASSPLESHFPDFNGGGDFASAAKYIVNLFLREVEKEEEDKPFASSGVYIHFTCGVDFRNMGILASAMQGKLLCLLGFCGTVADPRQTFSILQSLTHATCYEGWLIDGRRHGLRLCTGSSPGK